MLVLSVCSVTAIKRFARESLRDCGEAVQNKWLFFQVAQHGALVEALLTTSSCLNLTKKKKKAIYFLHAFKENVCEPKQHFDVHWAGLLLSLPFQLSCSALGCCVLPHLPGCSPCAAAPSCAVPQVGWDVCRTRRGGICVWGCECCCTDRNPRVGPNFLWTLRSSKEMGEIPTGASVCAWQGALVHEGKPCAAELDRNTHGSSFAWCF